MKFTKKHKIGLGIGIGVLLIGLGFWFSISKVKKATEELKAEELELQKLKEQSKNAKSTAEKAKIDALVEQQKAKVESTKLKDEQDKMGYAQYNSARAKEIATKLNNGELEYDDIYAIVRAIPTQNHYRQIVNTFYSINKHQTLDTFVKSKSNDSQYLAYQKMLNAKPRYNRISTTK